MACELPWFLGIPRDFSEKSWFYGTFLSPGVPYRVSLYGGPQGHRADSILRHRASTAESMPPGLAWGLAGSRLGWLGWLALGLIWFDLAWLGLGFGLIWLLDLIY